VAAVAAVVARSFKPKPDLGINSGLRKTTMSNQL